MPPTLNPSKARPGAGGAGARLVRLMQAVAEAEGDAPLKALAGRLKLPASTVHRLLQILIDADLLERAPNDAYRPGREFFRLSSLMLRKFDYVQRARPTLEDLWKRWQETCSFCLYKPGNKTALVVDTVRTPHPLQFVLEPLSEIPLVWGSLGRSILAFLPADEIDAALAKAEIGPLSGRPAPSRVKMREELQRIRQRRCAVYEDRAQLNLAGVAAPVFGPDRRVLGSLGVTMPASRFKPADQERLTSSVIESAAQLSDVFGFPGT
ncbi:MAG: IclR family transcriptional regulator [Hyphomonadaceae bacterium]|nr:IclR family transcriptional regulator [Hyphomonadaceae bacterium]